MADARADAGLDGLPVALHAKVAAAQAAWAVARCARHTVVPGHHWSEETDLAALRGGRALAELVFRCVGRAVVAARVEGIGWPVVGGVLGVAGLEAVFGPAVAGWAGGLACVRAGQVRLADGPALGWVVDTAWWAEALREWLSRPGDSLLDSVAGRPPENGNGWRHRDERVAGEAGEADAGLVS
ncbi:hypothetical protein [Streptomyces olivaceus]|uniref:hypothetical protein n=1 Tax=Streptomyces olivaceus TaxID=47716 RepID=UPI001CC9EDCC|nr:hypothetical protein [Streptomyces olivaceus]